MDAQLIELLKQYSYKGLKDWDAASLVTKSGILRALGNRVASNRWDVGNTIDALVNTPTLERYRFIPMPKKNHDGIKHCFFSPMRAGDNRAAFDLLLFVDTDKWLGFRFEPSDGEESTHGYGHVQLNRKMFKAIEVEGLPTWVPDSYPAFPIRTSDPLQMFLSVATAVHGYQKGIVAVLRDVFDSRPGEVLRYLEALKTMT